MNALTVDVEDYYHTSGLNVPIIKWRQFEDRVVNNTQRILECFDKHNVKGTFFIVGDIAKRFPSLVKEIVDKGHEIGSHSNLHQMLSEMSPTTFREDIRTSKSFLEQLSGQEVFQYRAPSWSLSKEKYDWLTILEEEGYRIDSSIQPFKTPLSGSYTAPLTPFHPIINGKKHSIIEYPSSVWSWGPIRIPFSGGFYLRAMPRAIVNIMLKSINRMRSGMIYIHPWELDSKQPRISAALIIQFVQYYRLGSTEEKLDWLLERAEFHPLGYVADMLSKESKIPDVII